MALTDLKGEREVEESIKNVLEFMRKLIAPVLQEMFRILGDAMRDVADLWRGSRNW